MPFQILRTTASMRPWFWCNILNPPEYCISRWNIITVTVPDICFNIFPWRYWISNYIDDTSWWLPELYFNIWREYILQWGREKLFNRLNIIQLGNGIVFVHKLQSIPLILTLADIILLLFLIAIWLSNYSWL